MVGSCDSWSGTGTLRTGLPRVIHNRPLPQHHKLNLSHPDPQMPDPRDRVPPPPLPIVPDTN
jgi:hypothetical protein